MSDGKLFDILIKESIGQDPATGMPVFHGLIVWADAGMADAIRVIPGIHHVMAFDTCYHVNLDPRYDREFLKAEIEAVAKCHE